MKMRKQMWLSWALMLLAALLSMVHAKPELRSRRMVGGTLAPNVPWHAMVYVSDDNLVGRHLGGALISNRWVLTAARYLFKMETGQHMQGYPIMPRVYLGVTSRRQANESTEVAVEKVVLHPNVSGWDNNLALLKLKAPVEMSDKVMPIPLPIDQNMSAATVGAVAGWGWGVYLSQSQELKHLVLPLNDSCVSQYDGNPLTVDTERMFCTGPTVFGENVCDGDAGGALAIRDEHTGDVYAAGILSYDKACGQQPFAVYMKLQAYLPWIYAVLRGDTETSAAQRSAAMAEMIDRQM